MSLTMNIREVLNNIPQEARMRIAPTPSGFLHKGNVYNILLIGLLAKKTSAHLHLRIDDMDHTRYRPHYAQHLFDILNYFNIQWHSGPKNLCELEERLSQTKRFEHYKNILNSFADKLFWCECSRKDIDGEYTGTCLNNRRPINDCCIRVDLKEFNYPILWRKDQIPAYHLVNIIEDNEQQINYIVRGEDLIDSTNLQLKLANMYPELFRHFINATFYHHPLIYKDANHKLSKSNHDPGFDVHAKQKLKDAFFSEFTQWLGITEKFNDLDELANAL